MTSRYGIKSCRLFDRPSSTIMDDNARAVIPKPAKESEFYRDLKAVFSTPAFVHFQTKYFGNDLDRKSSVIYLMLFILLSTRIQHNGDMIVDIIDGAVRNPESRLAIVKKFQTDLYGGNASNFPLLTGGQLPPLPPSMAKNDE